MVQEVKSVDWRSALNFLLKDRKDRRLYRNLLKVGANGVSIKNLKAQLGYTHNELQQRLSRLEKLKLLSRDMDRYYVPKEVAAKAKFMIRWFIPVGPIIVPKTLLSSIAIIPLVLFLGVQSWAMLVLWVFWILTTYAWIRRARLA